MQDILLRQPEVSRITALGRSRVYELICEGDFPRPVKIGARSIAWKSSEIQRWVDSRPIAKFSGAGEDIA